MWMIITFHIVSLLIVLLSLAYLLTHTKLTKGSIIIVIPWLGIKIELNFKAKQSGQAPAKVHKKR